MARSRQTAGSYLGYTAADTAAGVVRDAADAAIIASFPGVLAGLQMSYVGVTSYSVGAGMAANDNGTPSTNLMRLPSAMTKTLSAWVVGSGNGSLDTGSVTLSSWYHVHLIRKDSDGTIDVLLSLSPSAPTMPSGYTSRRRIGSIRTNASSQVVNFSQNGDVFSWDVPVLDVNATNPGTAAVTRTLTVPTGVIVSPVVAWVLNNQTTGNIAFVVTSLAQADTAPTTSLCHFACVGSGASSRSNALIDAVPANTSGQVRTRLSASGASDLLIGTTFGWIDGRGK